MARRPKPVNRFTRTVRQGLDYLRDKIAEFVLPFGRGPHLLELFVFNDLAAVRTHIMGAPRAALHTALNNPHCYLQCDCCTLENTQQLLPTLPDLSIVYKLHLESGHMINLFDWLQVILFVSGKF